MLLRHEDAKSSRGRVADLPSAPGTAGAPAVRIASHR
jgi:hypothetical protein